MARTTPGLEPGSVVPRRLTFPTGHRAEFWRGNCVAIGLSAGFIEPLEASAIVMIELAANMGIGHKVLFTGFLRGRDVDRVFSMADCYVMPSVSEPFGLAALEAISHDVPVILSKTSGASEVLTHVLKVDFWDIDEMANKILAVLRYPPLSQTLRQHGSFDLHRLTWEGAAERCVQSYAAALESRKSGARLVR